MKLRTKPRMSSSRSRIAGFRTIAVPRRAQAKSPANTVGPVRDRNGPGPRPLVSISSRLGRTLRCRRLCERSRLAPKPAAGGLGGEPRKVTRFTHPRPCARILAKVRGHTRWRARQPGLTRATRGTAYPRLPRGRIAALTRWRSSSSAGPDTCHSVPARILAKIRGHTCRRV